jgi:hypothetical protein
MFFPFFISLVGCGGVIQIASPTKSAADQGSLTLANPISPATRFVDGAIVVGKGLGYEVASIDRKNNMVLFTNPSSLGTFVLIGKIVNNTVDVRLLEDGRTIDISVQILGNFGEAEQAAVGKIIDDFKEGLAKQFSN